MVTYIIRRLLQMIPVILGAMFLIFAMVFALPGDPLAGKCGERPCPPAYAAAFREKYNLNDPLPVQYGKYLGNLAKGDLGETYNGIKVTDPDTERMYVTHLVHANDVLPASVTDDFHHDICSTTVGDFLDLSNGILLRQVDRNRAECFRLFETLGHRVDGVDGVDHSSRASNSAKTNWTAAYHDCGKFFAITGVQVLEESASREVTSREDICH